MLHGRYGKSRKEELNFQGHSQHEMVSVNIPVVAEAPPVKPLCCGCWSTALDVDLLRLSRFHPEGKLMSILVG